MKPTRPAAPKHGRIDSVANIPVADHDPFTRAIGDHRGGSFRAASQVQREPVILGRDMGQEARLCGAVVAILLWPSLLPVPAAGDPAASARPPPRLAVEEVLRQAARVTWTEENDFSLRHRLQRRTRGVDGAWSNWIDMGTGSDSGQDFVIDSGPDGDGLPPADYAWRAQSQRPGVAGKGEWSEWSAPAEFTMPPQCAGGDNPPGNETPGSLPTVVIRDLDGDGRYTGADVWIALQRCSKLGGCVLEALPVTYDDVAISLYGQNDTQACHHWKALVCEPMPPFPNGLVIQGHGSATVFRSPVWQTPYRPSSIFEFWSAPGVQLRFRNFVLDGRKREQPDTTPGVNDWFGWRHRGIDVTNFFGPDHSLRYPDGCVHNVTMRDFMFAGFLVDHARNWRIEYNRVQDAGCWKGLTECPRLTIPDTNPPPEWGCEGHKGPGYGIEVGAYSEDIQVIQNEITRVAKYAFELRGGVAGSDALVRLLARDNRVTNVGAVGFMLVGLVDGVVEHNLVDGTHQYGCREGGAWSTWGIQTHGTMRNTQIRDNTLRNLAGVGIGSNAVADGLVFSDNRIENACVERNAKVNNTLGAIHLGNESSGTFTLSNNRVTSNHCSMALAVCGGSSAEVVVDGGYYSTAEHSDETNGAVYVESGHSDRSPRVRLRRGAVVEYLGIQRRPGIVASGNGIAVIEDDSVQIKGYMEPFTTGRSAMDGRGGQKTGTIVRCAASPSSAECQ